VTGQPATELGWGRPAGEDSREEKENQMSKEEKSRNGSLVKNPYVLEELNPLLRGWGEYYKRAHVRLLFNRLDRWILHRIWSHRFKRWRNAGWKRLPQRMLYRDFGLVNLVGLFPSIASRQQ
jgi:hypothetical protein